MTVERYVPTNVAAAFGPVKPTDQSIETASIRTAFNAIDKWDTVLASMQIGPGTSRNILVDASGVAGTGNAIVIMMPAAPAIGDPPCRVALQNASYSSGASGNSGVYLQGDTGAGDKIHGSTVLLPRMYNAGAYIEVVWIGGLIGWEVVERDIGWYMATHATASGPNGALGEEFAFDGFKVITGLVGGSFTVQLKNLPTIVGDSVQIAVGSVAGTQINVGRVGGLDTVNGVASPVAFTTADGSKTVICTGVSTYEMV